MCFEPQAEFIVVSGFILPNQLKLQEGVINHFTNDLPEVTTEGEDFEYYNLKLKRNVNKELTDEGSVPQYSKI
jgi:hypothetical protein